MDREMRTHWRDMKTLLLFLALVQFSVTPTEAVSSPAPKSSTSSISPVSSKALPPHRSRASKPNATAPATSPKASSDVSPPVPKHKSPTALSPKASHAVSPSSPKHKSPPAASPKASRAVSPSAPKHKSPPAPPLDLSPDSAPSPSPERPKSKHVSPPAPPSDEGPAPSPSPSPSPSPLAAKPKHKSPPSPAAGEGSAPPPTNGTQTPTPASGTKLDTEQLAALKSLGVSTVKDPCAPSQQKISVCDNGKPLKHLVSLQLQYCSPESQMTQDVMEALSTLHSLTFMDCPMSPVRLPAKLLKSLTSFTCISSLGRTLEDQSVQGLSGVWLSRFHNLTKLTVSDVVVNASGPTIILSNMKHMRDVLISRTNLSGFLPKTWHENISSIDLSGNNLRGSIPSSMGRLSHLRTLDLSSNQLHGAIPSSLGKLLHMEKLALASNKLSGPIPVSFSEMPSLVYLDLSSNQLNGSIPDYLTELKSLRYLSLENNNFQGPVPFNATFIKKLSSFKISGNANVCFNHSAASSKLKLGVPPCDSSGMPIVPPDAANSEAPAYAPDNAAESGDGDQHGSHHHGPNKIVVAVAVVLSCILFLIIVCVVLSRWCSRRD
ncbi:hypothetical protein KI387_037666 [Taxus chinensis]|uniref:Leucine-rich repeat family protein n=1 Tax=Taxus chinensis TaxID=29808 RepID=A0AA38L6H1_TAXCH|nr:hypothetical protein KI387_037666 [Taxus chinensis]